MRWIYYNFRELGMIQYIPVLILLGMTMLCKKSPAETNIILKSFELFLPPLISLWIIPLFYSYVNEDTREVYLSYSCSRKKQGVFRILLFEGIYAIILILAFCFSISSWEDYLYYIPILIVQSFLYACIGFELIVMTKNIVTSIGIILAYVGIQILDTNHTFSLVGVCFYDMLQEGFFSISLKLIVELAIGIFFLLSAQRNFEKMNAV